MKQILYYDEWAGPFKRPKNLQKFFWSMKFEYDDSYPIDMHTTYYATEDTSLEISDDIFGKWDIWYEIGTQYLHFRSVNSPIDRIMMYNIDQEEED